jgi:hypothetical protein
MLTNTLALILAVLLGSGCTGTTRSKTTEDQKVALIGVNELFTSDDARKIVGEPVHLEDSSTAHSGDAVITHHVSYKANNVDAKSGKTGAIYILIERYRELPHAQSKYSNIKKANEDHEGIKVLDDLGDEAYFHSDGENFLFIMARKDGNVLTMKVNKITSFTSRSEFDRVAKKLISQL